MRRTKDDRGQSFWDLFSQLPGQVNISFTVPGQKRGFHMHNHKIDYWRLLQGKQMVVLIEDYQQPTETTRILFMEAGDELDIPSGVWHAYQNVGDEVSIMAYYETAKSGPSRGDDIELPLDTFENWQ